MQLVDLLTDDMDVQISDDRARHIPIAGLTADSREVLPGFLFAALPGATKDGRAFIADALEKGAAALLVPAATEPFDVPVPVIRHPEPRRLYAHMAARLYDRQPRTIAAVTGTNGKSSVVHFAAQLWYALGLRTASLGTIGLHVMGSGWDSAAGRGLTTPDAVALHRTLSRLAADGVTHLALEASSHGLDQHRLDGVRLAAAAFTNLSRDHLDYHPDMDAYFRAKAGLFERLLPPGGLAVVNADAPEFTALAAISERRDHRLLSYGRAGREFRLLTAEPRGHRLLLAFEHGGRRREATLELTGTFQAENVLCALALVVGTGAAIDEATAHLSRLTGAPGRMEHVAAVRGADVYVDYAHTPSALETVLTAIRPHVRGRLVVVIGAGGDRDRGKRPEMGRAAAARADRVIVTDDNPRNEDPAAIRAAILAACPDATEIGDRREAIRAAIRGLAPGDVLIIAGKGHEQGQIVGSRTLPFDDREIAREAAAELGAEDR